MVGFWGKVVYLYSLKLTYDAYEDKRINYTPTNGHQIRHFSK